MNNYICESCYRLIKETLDSCPKCGATKSYVPTEEFATPRNPLGPAQPVGAGTGGIMPKGCEEYLPHLPIGRNEPEKELEKKRSKQKRAH